MNLTNEFFEESCGYTVPIESVVTNQGEKVYDVLVSDSPCWNFGVGTNEKGTFSAVIGNQFKTFTFTLASGKTLANKAARMIFTCLEMILKQYKTRTK